MRKPLLCVTLLGFAVSLSSCTALHTVQTSTAKLQLGMTREQVRKEIGPPAEAIQRDSGDEVWAYYYNSLGQVNPGARSTSARLLVAYRDAEVVDWRVEQ